MIIVSGLLLLGIIGFIVYRTKNKGVEVEYNVIAWYFVLILRILNVKWLIKIIMSFKYYEAFVSSKNKSIPCCNSLNCKLCLGKYYV